MPAWNSRSTPRPSAGSAPTQFRWTLVGPDGKPLSPGDYRLITTAYEGGQNEFSSPPYAVRVTHGTRRHPAVSDRPAGVSGAAGAVSPPRDYRPLLLSVLYTGIGAGAFLVLEKNELGSGPRTALVSISGAALATGLAMSLRKPEPRPSPTNILYNQLLRELLSKRNTEIARENAGRRTQVVLRIQRAQ